VSHVFYCAITRSAFAASDLSRRRIHAQPPTLSPSGGFPTHPCCGALKLHFDVLGARHGCSGCGGCSFADHHVDDERGAVCFIGPVRALHNTHAESVSLNNANNTSESSSMERDLKNNIEEGGGEEAAASSSVGSGEAQSSDQSSTSQPTHPPSPQPNDQTSSPSSRKSSAPKHLSSDLSGNSWVTARRLLECQRDQLAASSQHPAVQQEIVNILRARAAERLLLRPPSPDVNKNENSTDKSGNASTANTSGATSTVGGEKRPNTPTGRSRKASQGAGGKQQKGSNRKGATQEEIEAEVLEVERFVNDLESLGPRDHHYVFRSIPALDDSTSRADDSRLLQSQLHPLTLFPEECIRDVELMQTISTSAKLDNSKKKTWEFDMLREVMYWSPYLST